MNYIANIPLIAIIYWLLMVNPYYCWILLFYIPNKYSHRSPFVLPFHPQAFDGAWPYQACAMPWESLATMRQSTKADGSAQAQQASDVTRRAKAAFIFLCEMCKELSYMGLFENGWTWDISFKCPFYCFLMRIMVTIQWNWDWGLNKHESIYKRLQMWFDSNKCGDVKPGTIVNLQGWRWHWWIGG